jgi:hypothetical protein
VVVGGGWGWGWGWGWPGWYGGYGYPGYYGDGGYGPPGYWAAIDTDIDPEEALVYLDGKFIGAADDFDGYPDYLYLGPGRYKLEFRLEGFEPVVREVDAQPGTYVDFKDKMVKIPGAKHYGSYETPKMEGPVRRFFAKRRGGNAAATEPSGPDVTVEGGTDGSGPGNGYGPPPPAHRDPRRGQPSDQWRGTHVDRGQVRSHLRLTVEPPDAAVYIDNRFIGTAEEVNSMDQGVTISPGHHTITVSRPGFREKTTEVTVEEGKTGSLEVTLTR